MDYTISGSGQTLYTVDPSISTASFTVSGSAGVGSDLSALNALAMPSVATGSYFSGSSLGPMDLFNYQVCHEWMTKFAPEERANFQEMISSGSAYLTGYSCGALREMSDRGLIYWGEPEIKEEKLRSMKLPLDPGYDLSADYSGPTIFVRQPELGGSVAIINGNHRTAKVLLEGAPLSASVYVLELASPQDYERLMGMTPSEKKYPKPRMPHAYYSFSSSIPS